MLDQLIQYDKELFLYLNNLGSSTWDSFWLFWTGKYNWVPLYAILLYLIFKNVSRKAFVLTVLVIVLLVSFTDQVTNLFKYGFERYRPCHTSDVKDLMRLVKSSCGGRFGYFSAHASNSMSVAIFVGLLLKPYYKYLVFILLFWSLMMAYSRIYVGVHFPLDMVSGMLFGALSGFMFYKILKFLWFKFKV